MPVSLLAFDDVASSSVSFGIFFLLQLSLSSPSVCIWAWELLCPSPADVDSQLFQGKSPTVHLTLVGHAVMVSES